MSRREYNIANNLPDGCIFYAPFTSDSVEVVSGVSGTSVNASAAYNSAENAYSMQCNTANNHSVSMLFNIPNWAETISNSYSMLCECKITSVNTSCYLFGTGDIYSDSVANGYPQAGSHNFSGISTNVWHKVAMVADYSALKQYFYLDGVLVNTLSRASTHATWKANWGATYSNFISLVFRYSDYYATSYIRNYYILNKAATLSEIRQIQGL